MSSDTNKYVKSKVGARFRLKTSSSTHCDAERVTRGLLHSPVASDRSEKVCHVKKQKMLRITTTITVLYERIHLERTQM